MTLLATAAAGLAAILWILAALMVTPRSKWADRFALGLLYLVGLSPIASAILAPRVGGAGGFTAFAAGGSQVSEAVARGAAWLALGSVPIALALSLRRRVKLTVPMGAMVGYGIVGVLSSVLNGQPIEASSLYAPAVFFSVGLLRQWHLDESLPVVRRILRIYIWASLGAAVAAPGIAYWQGQGRSWIGLPQLAGVTTHPNGLGSIAAVAIFAELVRRPGLPSPRAWHVLAAVAVLIATQSRGAWLSLALGLVFYLVARRRQPAVWAIVLSIVGIATVSLTKRLAASLTALANPDDAATLNGRTLIWDHLMPIIGDHLVLGIGPLSFDPRFIGPTLGLTTDPSHANAHNQVLQTLVERGMTGLAFLILLAVGLLVASARHPAAARGGLMAIAAVMVSRFALETPLFILPASQNAALLLLVAILVASTSTSADTPRLGHQTELDQLQPYVVDERLGRRGVSGGNGRAGRFRNWRRSEESQF